MSIEKMHGNLAAVVAQKIADHPGYPEFERWCQSQLMPASQIYFLVWQASRDALVIELPSTETFSIYSEEAARVMRDGCADAIREAGVKCEVLP